MEPFTGKGKPWQKPAHGIYYSVSGLSLPLGPLAAALGRGEAWYAACCAARMPRFGMGTLGTLSGHHGPHKFGHGCVHDLTH